MKEIPVAFKSHGQQVVGMLHLPSRKNAPIVIMHHGWSGNKLGPFGLFVFAARNFARHRFAVLRYDARGSGDSDGLFQNQTIKSQSEDMKAALDYICKQGVADSQRIGIIGHSQGGKVAILCAVQDKRIRCVDSWAGASGLKDFYGDLYLRELSDKGFLDIPQDGVKIIKKSVLQDFRPEYDSVRAIKKVRVPVQITSGTHDGAVPFSTAKLLYKNANKPKKLNVINGADHLFYAHKKQLIESSIRWFKRWL